MTEKFVVEKFSLGFRESTAAVAVEDFDDDKEVEEGSCLGGAARRAGLRAVVTKALAGGLAAYLCVRERETLRLRSELPF